MRESAVRRCARCGYSFERAHRRICELSFELLYTLVRAKSFTRARTFCLDGVTSVYTCGDVCVWGKCIIRESLSFSLFGTFLKSRLAFVQSL